MERGGHASDRMGVEQEGPKTPLEEGDRMVAEPGVSMLAPQSPRSYSIAHWAAWIHRTRDQNEECV